VWRWPSNREAGVADEGDRRGVKRTRRANLPSLFGLALMWYSDHWAVSYWTASVFPVVLGYEIACCFGAVRP
jgi:hypothetical protein